MWSTWGSVGDQRNIQLEPHQTERRERATHLYRYSSHDSSPTKFHHTNDELQARLLVLVLELGRSAARPASGQLVDDGLGSFFDGWRGGLYETEAYLGVNGVNEQR